MYTSFSIYEIEIRKFQLDTMFRKTRRQNKAIWIFQHNLKRNIWQVMENEINNNKIHISYITGVIMKIKWYIFYHMKKLIAILKGEIGKIIMASKNKQYLIKQTKFIKLKLEFYYYSTSRSWICRQNFVRK
jgi:hypothetical protein